MGWARGQPGQSRPPTLARILPSSPAPTTLTARCPLARPGWESPAELGAAGWPGLTCSTTLTSLGASPRSAGQRCCPRAWMGLAFPHPLTPWQVAVCLLKTPLSC